MPPKKPRLPKSAGGFDFCRKSQMRVWYAMNFWITGLACLFLFGGPRMRPPIHPNLRARPACWRSYYRRATDKGALTRLAFCRTPRVQSKVLNKRFSAVVHALATLAQFREERR